jgi:pSer/pThr/pTyr-binding forkhead associated (FHA) protein
MDAVRCKQCGALVYGEVTPAAPAHTPLAEDQAPSAEKPGEPAGASRPNGRRSHRQATRDTTPHLPKNPPPGLNFHQPDTPATPAEASPASDRAQPAQPKQAASQRIPSASTNAAGPHHCLVTLKGPRVLEANVNIVIGRDTTCDFRIVEEAVSRRHAKLGWREANAVLTDLDSCNGTFVNGKPTRERTLKDQDTIRIGAASLTYRIVSSMRELRDSVRLHRKQTRKGTTAILLPPAALSGQNDFCGSLATMGMPDICQMLRLSQRSGRLHILDKDDREASAFFLNGRLIHANYNSLAGNNAAVSMLRLREGMFSFEPGICMAEETVTHSTDYLLMEAMRQQDENSR